jgi:hypothetical protein
MWPMAMNSVLLYQQVIKNEEFCFSGLFLCDKIINEQEVKQNGKENQFS